MDISTNELPFQAKLGKNIIKKINREFNYDKTRTDKYARLFEDTFASNIDIETVIDINKNNNFVFSSNHFPSIKYQYISKLRTNKNIAKILINECSKIFSSGENDLFKIIISKYLNKGYDIQKLKKIVNNLIINTSSKKHFLENLQIAERLKNENPNSALTKDEFLYMQNKIMQEEAETPGTELYNLIHDFDKLDFSFS